MLWTALVLDLQKRGRSKKMFGEQSIYLQWKSITKKDTRCPSTHLKLQMDEKEIFKFILQISKSKFSANHLELKQKLRVFFGWGFFGTHRQLSHHTRISMPSGKGPTTWQGCRFVVQIRLWNPCQICAEIIYIYRYRRVYIYIYIFISYQNETTVKIVKQHV